MWGRKIRVRRGGGRDLYDFRLCEMKKIRSRRRENRRLGRMWRGRRRIGVLIKFGGGEEGKKRHEKSVMHNDDEREESRRKEKKKRRMRVVHSEEGKQKTTDEAERERDFILRIKKERSAKLN